MLAKKLSSLWSEVMPLCPFLLFSAIFIIFFSLLGPSPPHVLFAPFLPKCDERHVCWPPLLSFISERGDWSIVETLSQWASKTNTNIRNTKHKSQQQYNFGVECVDLTLQSAPLSHLFIGATAEICLHLRREDLVCVAADTINFTARRQCCMATHLKTFQTFALCSVRDYSQFTLNHPALFWSRAFLQNQP